MGSLVLTLAVASVEASMQAVGHSSCQQFRGCCLYVLSRVCPQIPSPRDPSLPIADLYWSLQLLVDSYVSRELGLHGDETANREATAQVPQILGTDCSVSRTSPQGLQGLALSKLSLLSHCPGIQPLLPTKLPPPGQPSGWGGVGVGLCFCWEMGRPECLAPLSGPYRSLCSGPNPGSAGGLGRAC